MKLKKMTIGVLVLIGLLAGSLAAGAILSGRPGSAAAQSPNGCVEDDDGQETADTEDKDNVQEEVQCGPQDEEDGQEAESPHDADTANGCVEDDDGQETAVTEDKDNVQEEVQCGPQDEGEDHEAEDADSADAADEMAPAGLPISADQAQAIVEAANPGVQTLAVEFDRENGRDLFEVELDNGQDVKVDATTGEILYSEARD